MSKYARERAALVEEAERMTGRSAHIVSRAMNAAAEILSLVEDQVIKPIEGLAFKGFVDDQLRLAGIKEGVSF